MRRSLLTLMFIVGVILLTAPAQADWFLGDPYKMHHPQLPNPDGWDVDVTTDTVYDDFLCTETGPINDLHFWTSWRNDDIGTITWIDVSLHGDVPAGADPDPLIPYSHPDTLMYGSNPAPLWFKRFLPHEFVEIPYGNGAQGWLAPSFTEPQYTLPDHNQYFQVNIPFIENPFVQQEGTIYWLGIHIGVQEVGTEIGWKTSLDNWNDDAAYYYGGWKELVDNHPTSATFGQSLDMAFVITPEPASLALLTLGGLALIRRR